MHSRPCYDPEIPVNIVDLGLVYSLEIEPGESGAKVAVKMTLTAPGCGMGTRYLPARPSRKSRNSAAWRKRMFRSSGNRRGLRTGFPKTERRSLG